MKAFNRPFAAFVPRKTKGIVMSMGICPDSLSGLDFGEVILGPVQQRAMQQAVLAGGALVTVIASIPINFGASKTGIEWHDIAAIAFACLIPNLTFLNNWFLPQSEREFLRNFCALEDAFYRREVKPKIDLFNKVVSQEFPFFRAATDEDYAQLLDRLEEALPSAISAIAEGKPSKKPVEMQIVDHVENPQKTD